MPLDPANVRDVVLFSTADWDHPFWTNKQHVAQQLCERGYRVLYVESLGLRALRVQSRDVARIARRLRRAWRPPRQVRDRLWVASPLALPWHGVALARRANERWLGAWLARQCARLGFERPIAWTYNPLVAPLAARLNSSLLVYHCVDDLRAAPQLPSAAIEAAEAPLARAADLVFTTSQNLQRRLSVWNPRRTHYLPNVADYDHFSQARQPGPLPVELSRLPAPRIAFVGALAPYKVDFELIAQLARARPQWQWVLIGQLGEGQSGARDDRLRLPNVHLLGPRPYAELPGYLRGCQAAIIPCPANDYTAAMFPMKFFEYLAAGLPVVAANVPALEPYREVCDLVDSRAEFERALARVLQGERRDAELCAREAREHTWQRRTDRMVELIEQAQRRRYRAAAEPAAA